MQMVYRLLDERWSYMRDMFTHRITTPEHWKMLMMPIVYTKAEMDISIIVQLSRQATIHIVPMVASRASASQ